MDMEKKSPLRDVMNSTMEKVREMVDANNIVGVPFPMPAVSASCWIVIVAGLTPRAISCRAAS